MKGGSEFKSANYPVAERRHLLETGTVWTSFTGVTVRLAAIAHDGGLVAISRDRSPTQIPYGAWISARSLLRNYKREDEV